MTLKRITLKMDPRGNTDFYDRLNLIQYDHIGLSFVITLYSNNCFNSNMNLLLYDRINANFKLSDGSKVTLPCDIIDGQNGILEIILTNDVTSIVGSVLMDITLERDSTYVEQITFSYFNFYVVKNPIGDIVI